MAAKPLDIPLQLPNWGELNRRCSQLSQKALTERDAQRTFVGAGYGGMLSNAERPAPDLGAGYQTIEFDQLQIPVPLDVTLSLANNTFSFDREGVWVIGLGVTFQHNDLNAGRLTNVRLFNVTDATPLASIVVATGRNAAATNFFQGNLFLIDLPNLSDELRFEIGGGDTYTSVVWNQTTFATYSVGQYVGAI